jgi:RNA polymerase sigma-70 factor (ECF subfamily)
MPTARFAGIGPIRGKTAMRPATNTFVPDERRTRHRRRGVTARVGAVAVAALAGNRRRARSARHYDRHVSDEGRSAGAPGRPLPFADPASRRWAERLRPGHPRREEAVVALHEGLRRAALHELRRRRGQLTALSGPEFDDVAQQCADDAIVNILARVDEFRGLSRFTTWAYKFVMLEVSSKVARHAWQRHPPSAGEPSWERLPDALAPRPGDVAERREQLAALARAIDEDLTPRQREVFVAAALNDVPVDRLALELGSNRNAVYKNLFDARRRLRASLAAAGHPLGGGGEGT